MHLWHHRGHIPGINLYQPLVPAHQLTTPNDRGKSALNMGFVTFARRKGHRKELLPMVNDNSFLPYDEIGAPFVAMRREESLGRDEMSANDAGNTLMAAPVSIRKVIPLNLSMYENKLLERSRDKAVTVARPSHLPVFQKYTAIDIFRPWPQISGGTYKSLGFLAFLSPPWALFFLVAPAATLTLSVSAASIADA